MARLEGRIGIVTGGAQGIGGATARRLAADGASVLIADVDLDTARQNADRIRQAGGTVDVIEADVARHDDIRRMVAYAVERWHGLDILVNNAWVRGGPDTRGSAEEVSEAAWDHGFGAAIKALFLATKYAVPELRKRGGGAIVNIASVHGLLAAPDKLVYETGKTAVIGLTRQMACQYGPDNIRVNAICPGHIVTERIQAGTWANNPEGLAFFERQYPLRRCGRPEDIAAAVAFLCSEDATFITGHALVVDGGLTVQLQEDLTVHTAHYVQEHPHVRLPY